MLKSSLKFDLNLLRDHILIMMLCEIGTYMCNLFLPQFNCREYEVPCVSPSQVPCAVKSYNQQARQCGGPYRHGLLETVAVHRIILDRFERRVFVDTVYSDINVA